MDIVLKSTSQVPIYRQIADQIRRQILTEQLPAGYHLPSIRALARDLQISVITTKKAYEHLEESGLIRTIPAKGVYVAAQNSELVKELRQSELEQTLLAGIEKAKDIGLSRAELITLIKTLYDEE